MTSQTITSLVAGSVFLILLLAIACFITFRKDQAPIPTEAMFIFRVVLALAGAGFAAILPGFFEIEGRILSFSVRAAGSLGVFLLIYKVNPPGQLQNRKKKLPKPKKRLVNIPEENITDQNGA